MTAELNSPILPRLLYRYRKLTDETIDREIASIKEPYLWFSKYRELNDPMEGFYETTSRVQGNSEYKRITTDILNAKRALGISLF